MPEPGWITSAKVKEVTDGDTVIVEVVKRFRVRLLDCWAPEVRTRDDEEKRKGMEAKNYLKKLINGKEVLMEIPAKHNGDIGKSISMSRVLGRIFLPGSDEPVSEAMIQAGHATREKQEQVK